MTTEELQALREKVGKVLGEPDPEDLCLICDRQMLIAYGLEPTPTCYECAQEIVTNNLPEVLNEVDRLGAALAEALKWKEEDPRMLRDQIRVADVAFNHLHREAEALKTQNKTLRDALLAVVAAEDSNREELGLLMWMVYRSNVDSDTKARSMKAINALLTTMP